MTSQLGAVHPRPKRMAVTNVGSSRFSGARLRGAAGFGLGYYCEEVERIGDMMRDKINILYYPDFWVDYTTLMKAMRAASVGAVFLLLIPSESGGPASQR